MKVRKKSPVIDAYQWFKHGDLAYVTAVPLDKKMKDGQRKKLGWIDTPQGGHIVFPGDWVLVLKDGTLGTCNPITFQRLYEQVDSRILPTPGQNTRTV
jgi:hypothetical protein